MASRRSLLPSLFVLGMAGCAIVTKPPATASAQGSTSDHRVSDGQMAHYQLALGDVAMGGGAIRRVLPVYPPASLATCAPVIEVPVQVIVGTTGKVIEVQRDPVTGDPVASTPPAFFEAVRTAVTQWRFAPLQVSHWSADADGHTHAVDSITHPFSRVYAFRFECHAGRATVSLVPAPH